MMLLYVHGRWRKEQAMEAQAGEVNQISGASLIGSANTARPAGCFRKVEAQDPAKKLSRFCRRVWRVWRHGRSLCEVWGGVIPSETSTYGRAVDAGCGQIS